jgi:hypothetical protein
VYLSYYDKVRNIVLICKYVKGKTCILMVKALLCCLSISLSLTNRWNRRVFQYAARLATDTRKRKEISPVLFHVHLLPVLKIELEVHRILKQSLLLLLLLLLLFLLFLLMLLWVLLLLNDIAVYLYYLLDIISS